MILLSNREPLRGLGLGIDSIPTNRKPLRGFRLGIGNISTNRKPFGVLGSELVSFLQIEHLRGLG